MRLTGTWAVLNCFTARRVPLSQISKCSAVRPRAHVQISTKAIAPASSPVHQHEPDPTSTFCSPGLTAQVRAFGQRWSD